MSVAQALATATTAPVLWLTTCHHSTLQLHIYQDTGADANFHRSNKSRQMRTIMWVWFWIQTGLRDPYLDPNPATFYFNIFLK
jgi:hypothetical protein